MNYILKIKGQEMEFTRDELEILFNEISPAFSANPSQSSPCYEPIYPTNPPIWYQTPSQPHWFNPVTCSSSCVY